MIHYLGAAAHAHTMRDFIATRGRVLRGRVRLMRYEALLRLLYQQGISDTPG